MQIDQIIQGLKKQDRKSQEYLVRIFASKLLSVCQRYCQDKQLAEDALQETFINVIKYIESYSGTGSFEGWLRKIAVSCCFAVNKKFNKLKWELDKTPIETIPSTLPDIFSTLNVEFILDKLYSLPLNQYVVFNMFVIEGFKHREIAELIGIKESTSRVILTRARANLILLLKNEPEYKFNKQEFNLCK